MLLQTKKNQTKITNTPFITNTRLSILSLLCIIIFANFSVKEKSDNTNETYVSKANINIQNYSDWNIKVRKIRKDGSKGNWSKELKPGSHKLTFDNLNKLEVRWLDGLKWKKYNEFSVGNANMCLKATGKVIKLNGIKIVKGC